MLTGRKLKGVNLLSNFFYEALCAAREGLIFLNEQSGSLKFLSKSAFLHGRQVRPQPLITSRKRGAKSRYIDAFFAKRCRTCQPPSITLCVGQKLCMVGACLHGSLRHGRVSCGGVECMVKMGFFLGKKDT